MLQRTATDSRLREGRSSAEIGPQLRRKKGRAKWLTGQAGEGRCSESAAGGRPGILVNVHPGLLHCGDGRLATTSFAVAARMGLRNNLLTVHSWAVCLGG
jgi:hypothetical protein